MAIPWQTLASVPTPEGLLELRRRGEKDFLITIDKRILMTSSAHSSEVALAELACASVQKVRRPRVLVSGLGMGFTLRAALDKLPADAELTVAELNPVVVEWCRGPLAPLIADALDDPRVKTDIVDVAARIAGIAHRADAKKFDAIVLDLFQGPHTRVLPNDPIYGARAMRNVRDALTPTGVLAVWGEAHSPGFERHLEAAGFAFEMHRPGRGALRHCVYVARARRGR